MTGFNLQPPVGGDQPGEKQPSREEGTQKGRWLDTLKDRSVSDAMEKLKGSLDVLRDGGRNMESAVSIADAGGDRHVRLLRSFQPLLVLLDGIADELKSKCGANGAVLLTDEDLVQMNAALASRQQLPGLIKALQEYGRGEGAPAPAISRGGVPSMTPASVGVLAGARLLGISLETASSLARLIRTRRKLEVADAADDALDLLGYLLESKKGLWISDSVITGQALLNETAELQEQLGRLQALYEIVKSKAGSGQDSAINSLLAEAENLLGSIHPASKPDDFASQVRGQALANAVQDKERLLVQLKAQTLQVREKKWYRSERIFATGEVQLAYRIFNPDGSLKTSGLILRASRMNASQVTSLEAMEWKSA